MQGIDIELKRACEDVISSCAEAVCKPIHAWLERVSQFRATGSKEELETQPWASSSAALALGVAFNETCHRDLRSAVARLRLYLEDDRTVSVLVKHAQEKIVDEYSEFRTVVWGEYGDRLRGEVMKDDGLRAFLQEVCGEGSPSGQAAASSS